MSDWGKGASSKKATPESHERQTAFLKCEQCGRYWTFVYYWPSQLKAIQGPRGGPLCGSCRAVNKEVKRAPSPPSQEQRAAVQMTLDDIFKAKK